MAEVRFLGFAGSLRGASYNRGLLRAATELAPAGIIVEVFDFSDLPFYNQDVEDAGEPGTFDLLIQSQSGRRIRACQPIFELSPASSRRLHPGVSRRTLPEESCALPNSRVNQANSRRRADCTTVCVLTVGGAAWATRRAVVAYLMHS